MESLPNEIIALIGSAIEESNKDTNRQAFDVEDFNEFSEIRY